MKLKATITGSKVHGVGYRVMLVNKALSLGISNFNVFNTFLQGNQAVIAVIEGDDEVIEEF
ncbi:MAG: acylphosphatase, partial [Euryarchaeota archaeon]|nr:acylphosphatase [Euryarchaeota archaeon]